MNSGQKKYHHRCYYTDIRENYATLRPALPVEQDLFRIFITAWTIAGQPLTSWKFPTRSVADFVVSIKTSLINSKEAGDGIPNDEEDKALEYVETTEGNIKEDEN